MTDYKCFTKCVKNYDKLCKVSAEHTNKNCHLKKISCCYAHDASKFEDKKKEDAKKSEPKTCKICCHVIEKCKCHAKSKSPQREKCICCRSPEREMCKVCCCLLINCICKKESPKRRHENHRPRTLCEDLPLYDENSHLLGYVKKGSIIDEPFCAKSRDKILEKKSISDPEVRSRARCMETDRPCMASCCYAEGVRRSSGKVTSIAPPRWTTKSAFDHATRSHSPSPTRARQKSPRKSKRKACVCET